MKTIASNKKAYHNYFILDKFEAGIELLGWEVKSVRAQTINLGESFVYFQKNAVDNYEAYLKNAHFSPYENSRLADQEPRRDRRLLLRRVQIDKIHKTVATRGTTCVVTKIYLTGRGLIKAEVAIARGKQNYDKKQVLRERDIMREKEREVKSYDKK
ncbi:MAG: SsrA-binding protein SmpB [Firmicutes bacterium]|nr:SsrA-binding protein SmpB [Bacillota bacterium]